MISLVAFAMLVQPCNSYELLGAQSSSGLCLLCLFSVTLVFAVCYVFYPAWVSFEGSLRCSEEVLVGAGDKHEGHILSLVIPAYNEEERLPIMLETTLEYLNSNRKLISGLFNKSLGIDSNGAALVRYELIIVDDGSTDDTADVVRKNAFTLTSDDTIKLVLMHKNSGKGGAVMSGMLRSSGQLCLMLDADGATDISDGLVKVLTEMAALLARHRLENSDPCGLPAAAVFGSRAHLEEKSCASRSKVRTFLMHAFHFFVKTLCSSHIKDTQCGFKLFTRSALVSLFSNLHLRRWAFDTELVVIAEMLNIPLSEVAVVWHEVDGSKLDIGKFQLALVSMGMLRDMICVRACYFLNIWKLN
ncbi:hypothetical protein HJC23_003315 [Cyclotella cryptica]|uniref:dolichyl-phosphate beta-glucosyltransferase n=1 Tax=Cyclotella cryptica TaxID=29204 RepID=A0ABD3QYI7_9STRA|eukprot:CCRYP_000863-RA/>CCRYP_000863-RA protein AED:0.06 eAED:0.06 QI:205/1/0.33/1/1/1/3/0/358